MKKMRVYETPVVQVVNLSSCAQLLAGSMLPDYDVQPEQDLSREFDMEDVVTREFDMEDVVNNDSDL